MSLGTFVFPLRYLALPSVILDLRPWPRPAPDSHQRSLFGGLCALPTGGAAGWPARALRRFLSKARPHPPSGLPLLPHRSPAGAPPRRSSFKGPGLSFRSPAGLGSAGPHSGGLGKISNVGAAPDLGSPKIWWVCRAKGRVLRAPRSGRVGSAAGPIRARGERGRGPGGGGYGGGRAGGRGAASRRRRRRQRRRLLSVRL